MPRLAHRVGHPPLHLRLGPGEPGGEVGELLGAHVLLELGPELALHLVEDPLPPGGVIGHIGSIDHPFPVVIGRLASPATLRPMALRALAIDLDGTLLTSSEEVSERNRAAVSRAIEAGFSLVVATARWYPLAEEVASSFGCAGPVIACSGAQVRRISDRRDLMDVRLPSDFAAALYDICDHHRCVATVAVDEEVVVKMDGVVDPALLPPGLLAVPSLSEATGGVAPRIALIQGSAVNDVIESTLGGPFGDRVRFVDSTSSAGKRILTLTATGADKGAALLVACRELGLDPGEVMAIGDAPNDVEMFRVAGVSVAMGQAGPGVKAAATSVTAPNDEDGVAVAIERLLAERPPPCG